MLYDHYPLPEASSPISSPSFLSPDPSNCSPCSLCVDFPAVDEPHKWSQTAGGPWLLTSFAEVLWWQCGWCAEQGTWEWGWHWEGKDCIPGFGYRGLVVIWSGSVWFLSSTEQVAVVQTTWNTSPIPACPPHLQFVFCLQIMRVWIAEAWFLFSRHWDVFPSSLVSHLHTHRIHLTPTPQLHGHAHDSVTFLTECHCIPFLSRTHTFIHSFPLTHTPLHPFILSVSYPQPPSFIPSHSHAHPRHSFMFWAPPGTRAGLGAALQRGIYINLVAWRQICTLDTLNTWWGHQELRPGPRVGSSRGAGGGAERGGSGGWLCGCGWHSPCSAVHRAPAHHHSTGDRASRQGTRAPLGPFYRW